jgi:drug/metabolite transporter (DMT)-like permease
MSQHLIWALVLVAAVIHALWNYVVKTIPGGTSFVWLGAFAVSIWMTPVLIIWLYFYPFELTMPVFWGLLVSSVLHLVYFLTLQHGYAVSDLSVVYPLARGSAPIFSSMAAVYFLEEQFGKYTYAGLAAVFLGVLCIANPFKKVAESQKLKLGLSYGITVGFLIACYTLLDTYLIRTLSIAPLVIEAVSHPLRVLVLWPHARKNLPEIKEIWNKYRFKVLFFALMSPTAFLMILYALKYAPVHFVAPARELSIVVGVILGGRLLSEEDTKIRILGSLLMVLGIGILAFGR